MHTPNSFIERIANSLGQSLNSKFIFADPIEREGVTIIPVARIQYGFGGGYRQNKPNHIAKGGGGGGLAQPVGYIEIKNGQATFKRINNPISLPSLILMTGITGFLLLRSIAKLIRQ